MDNNNNYKPLLDKIMRLVKEKPEFEKELRNRLANVDSPAFLVSTGTVENDIHSIKEIMGISAQQSIDYLFVKSEIVRKQLIIDNLKMENAPLNLAIQNESERFCAFCINAFYQVENLVNYYYGFLYPDNVSLVSHIQTSINKSDYRRELTKYETEDGIARIRISDKMTAIAIDLKIREELSACLYYLREIRNIGSHRCSILREKALNRKYNETDKNKKMLDFMYYNTYNTIRANLMDFVSIIKKALHYPKKYKAIIKRVLPSAVFLTIPEEFDIEVPNNLIVKYKEKMIEGDLCQILVDFEYGKRKVVDIL